MTYLLILGALMMASFLYFLILIKNDDEQSWWQWSLAYPGIFVYIILGIVFRFKIN